MSKRFRNNIKRTGCNLFVHNLRRACAPLHVHIIQRGQIFRARSKLKYCSQGDTKEKPNYILKDYTKSFHTMGTTGPDDI